MNLAYSDIIGKVCFKCNIWKPIFEYYAHPKMKDGHLGKCKKCTCIDSNNNLKIKQKNPEFIEKEKARARDKHRRLYKDIKPLPEAKAKYMENYRLKYPEKSIAKNKVSKLIKVEKGYHKHHWSYRNHHHLDVIILIERDHAIVHRHLHYDRINMMYRSDNGELLDSRESHVNYLNHILDTVKF